jgi:hypothetical protein
MAVVPTIGAGGFGALIGWYVYYVNRYRKGDVQFSDLTTLVGVIGGAGITRLFSGDGGGVIAAGDLFGAYGIGLFLGFFGYFVVLLIQVRVSPNFTIDWFLDGRRRRALEPFWVPEEIAGTMRPEAPEPRPPLRVPRVGPPAPMPDAAILAPAAAAPIEPSGAFWCARYPGSTSIGELMPNFQTCVRAFVNALLAARAAVEITSTYRPPERAYLMHYAYQIARLGMDPRLVPPMRGIGISWLHRAADGSPDIAASRQAAQDMVTGYGMVFIAQLASRHTERRAIDMTITWHGELQMTDAQGVGNRIDTNPRDGTNSRLHTVAKTYGVMKLLGDPVHWSDDCH